MSPPGLTHLTPACLALGLAQKSTASSTETRTTSTGHLRMLQSSDRGVAHPDDVTDLPCHRSADDDDDRAEDEDDHGEHGDADPDRQGLPDRPALADVVDDVGRAHERGDVARGRPERDEDAEDGPQTGPGAVGLRLGDQGLDELGCRAGGDAVTWLTTWSVVSWPSSPRIESRTMSAGHDRQHARSR